MAKVVKPNVLRGQIFDKLAEAFGNSVLGMYDGKLRIEVLNEQGEPVQFSLAPVVHKALVDEEECDDLVPIDEQVAAYESIQSAKEKEKADKKATTTPKKKKKATKKDSDDVEETKTPAEPTPEEEVVLSEEEQQKLEALNAMLDGDF